MPNTLVFPDGVRLAHEDELPGPTDARKAAWARIQSASIQPGFVLHGSKDERIKFYAEANVDASDLWATFCDLCRALLASEVTLVFSEIDEDPRSLRTAQLEGILSALGRYKYQLAHDGYVQFGLIADHSGALSEVFVAPTKHLKIWLSDRARFSSVMALHDVPEVDQLEFLDSYPRTTAKLPSTTGAFHYTDELAKHLEQDIDALDLPD